jgi:putative ABC transport system substrate-binding protein
MRIISSKRISDSCSDNLKSKINNLKSAALVAIGLTFMMCGAVGEAQQAKKISRIAFLIPGSSATYAARIEAFRQGLRELGYVEGKDITIEYRYAEGKIERLPNLVAELIGLKFDLIVAAGSEATAAAKNATKEIPIVMTNINDAVRLGFVASLAHPGGNITGLILNFPSLDGKRLELLKETVPKLTRVAILTNPQPDRPDPEFKEVQAAAQALGLKLQILEVRTADDIEAAFRAASRGRAGALLVLANAFTNFHQKRIAELAIKSRLPAMYTDVDAGFLMSYAANRLDLFRRAATYVDKILKGRKPADLPVELPMKFEFVINLKTAKQIGLTVPPNVLVRADKVIR